MNVHALRAIRNAVPAMILTLAAPAWGQDGGPMAPAQNTPAATSQSPAGAPANAAPVTSTNASQPAAAGGQAAMIEVPGGTHIPLLLHNAVSTRTAAPSARNSLEINPLQRSSSCRISLTSDRTAGRPSARVSCKPMRAR